MSTKQIFYAAVGAGDLAVETARKASPDLDIERFRKDLPKSLKELRESAEGTATKVLERLEGQYQDLVKRGEKTFDSIRKSSPTRKAVKQTKSARSQTKAAVTSAKKAASEVAEATTQAADKVG